jgi:hypothetical protein
MFPCSFLTVVVKVIVALTESGRTAALISKYRPSVPVLCVTPNEQVCCCTFDCSVWCAVCDAPVLQVARQSLVFRSLYPLVQPRGEVRSCLPPSSVIYPHLVFSLAASRT